MCATHLASAPKSPSARRAFRQTDICTRGWYRETPHSPAARRGHNHLGGAGLAPDPFENTTDGVFVKSLDGVFGRVADADHVDHRLHVGERLAARRHGAVDGAKALPESEDMSEIVEVAFARAVE